MRALVVKPLEPLSLSATPITGVDVFSYTRALSTPLPTTLLGALGALLDIQLSSTDPIQGISELVSKVRQRLNCGDVVVKGPLVYFKVAGVGLVGPTVAIHTARFYKPECIVKSRVGYEISGECREHVEYEPRVFVGIALQRRDASGDKLVMPGFTYRYPLGLYRYVHKAGSKVESKYAEPVFVYALNCKERVERAIVRFGGEGRVAEVYTSEEEELIKRASLIKSPLEVDSGGVYIALAPIPLLAESGDSIYLDAVKGLEFCSDVVGVPQIGPKPPKVVVERLGLGYYEVSRIRRPQILALPAGTIVRARPIDLGIVDLLKTLYMVGFASLYPLQ
jgi:hypothetical protein